MQSTSALIFPGQGSQYVGMLSNLAEQYPEMRISFEEVSARLNYDVWALIQEGPETLLNQTEFTQTAMLTADVALYRIFKAQTHIQPTMMAGHSLGEYAALVCADAITLADAAALVAARGRFMQETIPLGVGAMAAIIGLSNSEVEAICTAASDKNKTVSPANYNAEGQVVIAGHTAAVSSAIQLAEEKGARFAKIIPVSVPCHCDLLKPAALKFRAVLDETTFQNPRMPVISNVDLSTYSAALDIRNLLEEQLYKPVRWVETIELMKRRGVETMIECGPGKVLTGLIKRIDKSLKTISLCEALEKGTV